MLVIKLNKKGQALVEYVLIIALVTVIAVSLIKVFGGYLKDSITKTSCSMVDKVYKEGAAPGEATCVSKDYSK